MEFNELTEEQKTKVRAAKTPEELIALAEEEGVELTDTQLEAMSGGSTWIPSCETDCGMLSDLNLPAPASS